MLKLTDRLLNHTEQFVYHNPIDIATVIDLMGVLVKTQVRKGVVWGGGGAARNERGR